MTGTDRPCVYTRTAGTRSFGSAAETAPFGTVPFA